MEKSYTAVQPLAQQARLLTGQSAEQTVWPCSGPRRSAGQKIQRKKKAGAPGDGAICRTVWEPLCLGRIALPATVCRTSYWMTDTRTLNYTPETAAAMAKRACRRQLIAGVPRRTAGVGERRNRTDAAGHAMHGAVYVLCGHCAARRGVPACAGHRRLTLGVQTKNGVRHFGGRRSVKKSWFGQVFFHISLQPVKSFGAEVMFDAAGVPGGRLGADA